MKLFFVCTYLTVLPLLIGITKGERVDCFRSNRTCHSQNRTEGTDFDVRCNNSCKIEQCTRGCQMWQVSLGSSCQDVCNGTEDVLPEDEIYCMMGCNFAVNAYIQQLQDDIGIPTAPALVADSLTNVSLNLEWSGSSHPNVLFLLQWRYDSNCGSWQYFPGQTPSLNTTGKVDDLRPYTKYRFRVAWFLAPTREPLLSRPSVTISTLASGPPSSVPVISTVAALDAGRISLSWTAAPFPNGPILSYVIQLRELPAGYSVVKDVPANRDNLYYLFSGLKAGTNYSVEVAARNSVGEGPQDIRIVTTPPCVAALKDQLDPYLILGAKRNIIKQGLDMMDDPSIVYNSSYDIIGVAVHISKRLLFISDSAGYIRRVPLINPSDSHSASHPTDLLSPAQLDCHPADLSVDWLNDMVYFVGEVSLTTGSLWQMYRFHLNGHGLKVVLTRLHRKPLDFQIDPFNGNMYWVESGTPNGGLYKLDLADIDTERAFREEVQPSILFDDRNLGAFTVDHLNFRLLVSHRTENTVFSIALDGSDPVNIRDNTQQPRFQDVLSLVTYNGVFYWTNGQEVLGEEYFVPKENYFHNSYSSLSSDRPFLTLSLVHPDAQPMPTPVNPPRNLQAIFSDTVTKVMWKEPHLLVGMHVGKGAWQNWLYELYVRDVDNHISKFTLDINSTVRTVHSLNESTAYSLQVRAYSEAGKGPWSREFNGHTLHTPLHNESYPVFFWSSEEGLLSTDVLGENVETVIHKGMMQESNGNSYSVMDISWYKDKLFLVLNNSHILQFNMTSRIANKIADIDSAGSIAVDWIGRKMYWSSPKNQLITRANLDGSQQEPLPLITVARELNIDSISAHVYWSTGHSVECARLHGAEHQIYYQEELFSGKQVAGLTLDIDKEQVYWVVRSYEGSVLFRALTAENIPLQQSHKNFIVEVGQLEYDIMQGPLRCFGSRLVWLQDEERVIVADMNGQNAAVFGRNGNIALADLKTVAIIDQAARRYPGNLTEASIQVVPAAVEKSSLRVDGTWEAFNITWNPASSVTYGQVFYEIKVDGDILKQHSLVTRESVFPVPMAEFLSPYSSLQVTLRAFTYWGSSQRIIKRIQSPPGPPSRVRNPRIFVTHTIHPTRIRKSIEVQFRWDPPAFCNGIIGGYVIHWCIGSMKKKWENSTLSGQQLHMSLNNVVDNTTYYFKVRAFTIAGLGPASDEISAETSEEKPVPKLLAATLDGLHITDIDSQQQLPLARNIISPLDIAYSYFERKVFWINEEKELMTFELDGSHKTKILSLKGTAQSLCIDWVSRFLYWSEQRTFRSPSTIRQLDLSQDPIRQDGKVVLTFTDEIYSLDIDPVSSQLFWVSVNKNGFGTLMVSNVDGTLERNLFNRTRMINDNCTCPSYVSVGKAMSLDHSSPFQPGLLWVDARQHHIHSSDIYGCYCSIVVNASEHLHQGLPPSSLTVDENMIYWSNTSQNQVYFLPKSKSINKLTDAKNTTYIHIGGIRQIVSLGDHLQSYPETACLLPLEYGGQTTIKSATDSSVTIQVLQVQNRSNCPIIKGASYKYILMYGLTGNDTQQQCIPERRQECAILETYQKTVTIHNLIPYSKYIFYVFVSNYYSNLQNEEIVFASPAIFETAAGAPWAPSNLTVIPVSPSTLLVSWLPPERLNGPAARFELHWRTSVGGIRKTERKLTYEDTNFRFSDTYWLSIPELLSHQVYTVKVRAYSQSGDFFNDTEEMNAKTLSDPNNITLIEATAYSLIVSWIPPDEGLVSKSDIQYQEATSKLWQDTLKSKSTSSIQFTAVGLRPKTYYSFRLNVTYTKSGVPYIWPKDGRFMFETLGTLPEPPGIPVVRTPQQSTFEIQWEPSVDNGGPIQIYELHCQWQRESDSHRNQRDVTEADLILENEEELIPQWVSVYNGTENKWEVTGLDSNFRYVFRVRSKNEYGWSLFSDVSQSCDFATAAFVANEQKMGIVFVAAITAILVLVIAVVMILFFVLRRKEKEKKSLQPGGSPPQLRPDLELATLRELPHHTSFVHQSNALYTGADIPLGNDSVLPIIKREQITLTKFLGSGAFGEVFEGYALGLPYSDAETHVAVKTLRKGASDQEKLEFLKEAQLMSNFKHEHIIHLLGVCVDNDPIFILLELMEGGDLLSYLRNNRSTQLNPTQLTLLDLISLCVDVAKGCCYLEEMHFVHRDLAARNCLVSSTDPATRIAKIGDFGLARDIYKNDYYRKEGEGLLPVRWMSPESLVDGVFTSQSDVWSFGVLLWEVLTLGQQPYPARTNLEVLHYVRSGGRLVSSPNWPFELHQLMLKCWQYNPGDRPTFKYCLEQLQDLIDTCDNTPVTTVHNGQYIGRRMEGFDNNGYLPEELFSENSGGSWKNAPTGEVIPFLRQDMINCEYPSEECAGASMLYNDHPSCGSRMNSTTSLSYSSIQRIPQYLELISDTEVSRPSSFSPDNGYEIPRTDMCSRNCTRSIAYPSLQTKSSNTSLTELSDCIEGSDILTCANDNFGDESILSLSEEQNVLPQEESECNDDISDNGYFLITERSSEC